MCVYVCMCVCVCVCVCVYKSSEHNPYPEELLTRVALLGIIPMAVSLQNNISNIGGSNDYLGILSSAVVTLKKPS